MMGDATVPWLVEQRKLSRLSHPIQTASTPAAGALCMLPEHKIAHAAGRCVGPGRVWMCRQLYIIEDSSSAGWWCPQA
jgi:hypothetical protein